MMWPRLRLLHELLSDRGSIWITLDDNEMHHARGLLDSIFGGSNSLGVAIWEKADSPRMDADFFSTSHDYVIAYAKDKSRVVFQRLDRDDDEPPEHYNMKDEEGRKYYLKPLRAMGGQGETREARPKLFYGLDAPDGTKVFPKLQDGRDGAWRWSPGKLARESQRIEWRNGKGGWTPYFRIFADSAAGRPPETIFYNADVGSSRTAKAQIKALFGGTATFETPKPLGLLERILEIATTPDALVLDSFAGSGTTAHAVVTANQKDGGNRKFVLVECEDYADTLTAERMRRVMKGYSFEGTQKEELLREKLNFTSLKKADQLLKRVVEIENVERHRFDSIKKEVKDGELIVTGKKQVQERAEGLGGSFTYCTWVNRWNSTGC
jgi:adenine-specific DNA-methyltransferase